MSKTKISWTNYSWNPMTGCSKASLGCNNCYAKIQAEKWPKKFPAGFSASYWPDRLVKPARWRKPRRIFVNSMSDLFHKNFTNDQIPQVFEVMTQVNWHIYQVLTKRDERMRDFIDWWLKKNGLASVPEHIWLGVTVEADKYVKRADSLRQVPAKVRFISAEPLLNDLPSLDLTGIDWLIVGAESGKNRRTFDPAWAEDLRKRAAHKNVEFFFKQGSHYQAGHEDELNGKRYKAFPQKVTLPSECPLSEPERRDLVKKVSAQSINFPMAMAAGGRS